MDLLTAAVKYARRGWHVFPLVPGKKVPATSNGLYAATTNLDILEGWWSRASDVLVSPAASTSYEHTEPHGSLAPTFGEGLGYGVGIRTGLESNLVVLDVDKKSGGFESLKELGDLPATYTVTTAGGGRHYYFIYPEGLEIGNRANMRPGLDLRANGGYVVAPPTTLADGSSYTANSTALSVAALPQSLLSLIMEKRQKPALEAAGEGLVAMGGRNDYLSRVAGYMQRANCLTLEGLEAINDRDCVPPLDPDEVGRIFESVSRYEPEESLVPEVPKLLWARDLAPGMIHYLKDRDRIEGLSSGFPGLDRLMGGGS